MHQHLREIMTQECQVPCWLVGRSMLMGLSLNQWEDVLEMFFLLILSPFLNLGSNIKVKRSPPIAWNLESSCMIIPQISPLVHKDWDGNFPKFLWFLFSAGILTGINLPVTNYLGSAEPNGAIDPSQITPVSIGKTWNSQRTTWRYPYIRKPWWQQKDLETYTLTLPKFNMEPKNEGFQKESPIPGYHFQVPC